MPTPRPIIVARVGPLVGIGEQVAEQADQRPARRPSPTTAVMIGIPIATRLPSTRLRMIIATRMPTTSLVSESSVDRVVPMDPAAATLMCPASCAGFGRVEDVLGDLLGQVAGADVQQHRRERRLLVLRQQARGLAARC